MSKRDYFIHQLADVMSKKIGKDTKVWQFVTILPGAIIGENCNICSHVFIENDVIIGDNVTIKNSSLIFDGVRIENNAFIGPNVTFTNDKMPKSQRHLSKEFLYPQTRIRSFASIGAGVTILPGVEVGAHALVGAGSLVNKDVEPNTIVFGSPAVPKLST